MTGSATDEDVRPLVAATYLALAGLLEETGPSSWDSPSACEGWLVRHVVAHVTMPARYDDVTVPLGVPRVAPEAALVQVLDDLTAGGGSAHFGVDLAGRAFRATDLDWGFGAGEEMEASADVLVLRLCGRR